MRFRVTWSTGKVEEVEQSDVASVDDFINTLFGSAWEAAKEAGVTVEEVGGAEAEPAAETPSAVEAPTT